MGMKEQESGLSFERIVFFSDAVFAIVITLLVLEIKPPHLEELSDANLNRALLALLPKFIGFVISFLMIGLMWIAHHRMFRFIKDYDAGLLRRNLLLLLFVSFVPFPTALFSEYYGNRTALILYTASFAAVGITKLWLWQYAVGKKTLVDPNAGKLVLRGISRRSWAVPLACVLVMLLSLVNIRVAPVGFASIPFLARLLDRTGGTPQRSTETAGTGDAAAT
jgi:uncharacterized membrane protein